MPKQAHKESDFGSANEPVFSHEFGSYIKGFSSVVKENGGIDGAVNYKKGN